MADPASMYDIQTHEGVHVVVFKRNLFDPEAIDAFRRELRALIDREPKPRLVLDCTHLRQVSSLFLGALMELTLKLRAERKGQAHCYALRLCGMSPQVFEVFSVMRLNESVHIHPDLPAALASFEGCP